MPKLWLFLQNVWHLAIPSAFTCQIYFCSFIVFTLRNFQKVTLRPSLHLQQTLFDASPQWMSYILCKNIIQRYSKRWACIAKEHPGWNFLQSGAYIFMQLCTVVERGNQTTFTTERSQIVIHAHQPKLPLSPTDQVSFGKCHFLRGNISSVILSFTPY